MGRFYGVCMVEIRYQVVKDGIVLEYGIKVTY